MHFFNAKKCSVFCKTRKTVIETLYPTGIRTFFHSVDWNVMLKFTNNGCVCVCVSARLSSVPIIMYISKTPTSITVD